MLTQNLGQMQKLEKLMIIMTQVLNPIKIYNLNLDNNLFIAPMEGFTNVAFRKNIQKHAQICGFTEMIPAISLSKDRNYCKDLLYRDNSEKYLIYQLFGNKPEDFAKAIDNIDSMADGYNINCGCPADNIVSQGAGCALLRRKNRICDIITKMRKTTDKPITIKIRTGYSKTSHLDYKLLESIGCNGIFIHGRTGKQKYSGNIDYNYIKIAKENSVLPIIGNGDLCRLSDLEKMKLNANVDGYMIGRACLHNPFVFRDLINNKDLEKWATSVTINEKIDFLSNYYNDLGEYKITGAFNKTKTLGLFLFRYVKDAKKIRNKLVITKSYKEFFDIIKNIGD